MKFVSLFVLLVLVLAQAGAAQASLREELAKPENYPAYLYKNGKGQARAGTFLIDGKLPMGPIQCEHVRIVEKRSDVPLNWEDRNTGASNVYYHIHRAIDYYNKLSVLVGEPIYREKKPVIVRLDMDADWAMWIRFSNQERFNTSQTFPDIDPDKWGTDDEQREIWFFIPKRKYMPFFIVSRYIPGLRDTWMGTRGFPVDSAEVPSMIYHEWTHLMTRPYLGIIKDTPLNEGYSDYYGSVIWGRPEMGKMPGFSTKPYERDYSHDPRPITARDSAEPGNFVPKFFWSLRRRFGGDRTDALLWRTLKQLTPQSKLKDLPAALFKAAEHADFSRRDRNALKSWASRLFTARGRRSGS